MFKKGLTTLVCLTVMSALWSWAAATYSITTKITSLGTYKAADGTYKPIVGGTVKVRDNAEQTAGLKYTNFTTVAPIKLTVDAADGYKIASLTLNGTAVTGAANQTAPFEFNVNRPNPVATQAVVATFAVDSGSETVVSKTWQLQVQNNNGGGVIKVARPAGTLTPVTYSTVGKPWVKNYVDTTSVKITVDADPLYFIDYIIVNGKKTFYTQNDDTVDAVTINPNNGRIWSVLAGYKKRPIKVTTQTATYTDPKTGEVKFVDNGILPVNPAADPFGTVRLVITPTGTDNVVKTVVAKAGTVELPVTLTDRFGDPVVLPHTGAVKATITGITSAITVTATYGLDASKTAGYVGCTQTCHQDSGLDATVKAADTNWLSSKHKTANVDCIGCHQTMPGPDLSTPAAKEALCAGCHTSLSLHKAEHNACSTCHAAFGDSHAPTAQTTHKKDMAIDSCGKCHTDVAARFTTSQHGTRQGKDTWYSDNINNPAAPELQKGFGNYVNVTYTSLPCGKCHAAAAWTPEGGTDQWMTLTGGKSVCQDCHGNRTKNADGTAPDAPVTAATCKGCHSRQGNEGLAGLTDVHSNGVDDDGDGNVEDLGCMGCHSTADMHGTGTQTASQLVPGTISANCANCHGVGKVQGPINMTIAEHSQHIGNIDCSTCHTESMITCHNCHFDNEAGAGSALKAKFFSGRFGGKGAASWRYLVNRKMQDGSYKVFPGSMQSLVADYTAKDDTADPEGPNGDGVGRTHAGIAPYYSHSITKTAALRCAGCHGTDNSVKLAAGIPVRIATWNKAAGENGTAADFTGPSGVIPVPENPKGKLLMDFVDLVDPSLGPNSPRVLFQKDGPDSIHMPEAFVKPMTAEQMQDLAMPYRAGLTTAAAAHAESQIGSDDLTEHTSCATCHVGTSTLFATSQHGTRQGKDTWYSDNLNNPEAPELQKGFGNYVTESYASLPCGKCHAAAAWSVGGVDKWAASTGGKSVCTDCHGNRAAGVDQSTVYAPVAKSTCNGCHSRQANEVSSGLTDVHSNGIDDDGDGQIDDLGCMGCHSTTDMHGTGSQTASQLVFGTISAQCENCHGVGKKEGPISNIAAHLQHADDIACATCHTESMITCHNCHFDNEAGAGGAAKAKFFSGKFGGTHASGNSWRYLVNRVMPDGSTKIYPGSMQSLVADYTALDGTADPEQDGGDGVGRTHAGIAPYYSHSITRVNALSCDKCHGSEAAVKLHNGESVRVTTWNAEAGVAVPAASVAATFTGPKGVIPVPENPKGKLLMDFVDLTNPAQGTASDRVLFQKDGPDSIHMPEKFVKPLTAEQIAKLANVDHTSAAVMDAATAEGYSENSCKGCHSDVNASYATSQHFTKNGKATWFNDHLGNTDPALEMQTGFGNYVTVGYDELPCKNCHNGVDNGPWDTNSAVGTNTQLWPGANCTECHTNRTTYNGTVTAFDAPVTKETCYGCHSRQKKEVGAGLTDVHTNNVDDDGDGNIENLACIGCHSLTDMHGTGSASTSQLQWGTISAQCDNCHGAGKQQGMVNTAIPEHDAFHLAKLDCSTCHVESVVTCNNCHFDNEMGGPGITKLKFASGFFGGPYNADSAQDKSWRYLINRVMPGGGTKVYPASMQSLYTDVYAKNAPGSGTVAGEGDDTGWSHAGIAPYYSHSITKVNALKCDRCHGVQAAIDLNEGRSIRVVTWTGADDATVAPTSLGTLLKGPKGIIPVPENPKGKLYMDFVDLVDPDAAINGTNDNIGSYRKLAQRNGPNSIHIPEAFARPLTGAQINSLSKAVDRSTGAFLP